MPSAWKDKRGRWLYRFRDFDGDRRTCVVPKAITVELVLDEKVEAWALKRAGDFEDFCRRIRSAKPAEHDVDWGEDIGALSKAQAAKLRGNLGVLSPPPMPVGPETIHDALHLHPSVRREMENSPREYRRHMSDVAQFIKWAKVSHAREITVELVDSWVQHLLKKGRRYDTIRHKLLYLRYAARLGNFDSLRGVRFLKRGEAVERAVERPWFLEELIKAAQRLHERGRPRELALLGLGGFMGLRFSEMARIDWEDYDEGEKTLRIGKAKSKTSSSRRTLPVPETVSIWINALPRKYAPMFHSLSKTPCYRGNPTTPESLARNVKRWVEWGASFPATDNGLRKAFASWTIEAGMHPDQVEEFMGHSRAGGLTSVTRMHYLNRERAERLRKAAGFIEECLDSGNPGWQPFPEKSA